MLTIFFNLDLEAFARKELYLNILVSKIIISVGSRCEFLSNPGVENQFSQSDYSIII